MNARGQRWILLFVSAVVIVLGCRAVAPLFPDRITRLFDDRSGGALGRGVFSAIQIDPVSEDSAGPAFLAVGDLDRDGVLDVATAWNESKPLQLHFQRRAGDNITFETITLVGDIPITIIAGLAIADMDGDGINDVILLDKDSGVFARCRQSGETLTSEDAPAGSIIVYYGPAEVANATNALAWEEVTLSQSQTAGAAPADSEKPEEGGFTSMAIADFDGANGPDIAVAWNANDCEGGGNRVEFYLNPGPGLARQASGWAPLGIDSDAPPVKSVKTADIDRDGDIDIVATFPSARGQRVRWYRNPRIDVPDVFHVSDGTWQRGTVGQIEAGADIIEVGDIDNDGIVDVAVRSTSGRVLQWFKGPEHATTPPVRNIPWQVYSIAEFPTREPLAMTLADFDGDGQLDIVASAEGAIVALRAYPGSTVYDQWQEELIFDDPESPAPTVTDPNVDPSEVTTKTTVINQLAVVDLDGDGNVDVIGTLNRRDQSGLTNDAIVWFRRN